MLSGWACNLLDFNDMDMDSTGRLHIAFADGCTEECSEQCFDWRNGTADAPTGKQSRDSWGTVLRQTGLGLFAEHDAASPSPPTPPSEDDEDKDTPGQAPALAPRGDRKPFIAPTRRAVR